MAMHYSKQDLYIFYQQLFMTVAKRLNISDYEWKSAVELISEIESIDQIVANKITLFIDSYQEWYSVHEEIDESGNVGNLTAKQSFNLAKAIENRDATRTSLLQELMVRYPIK